MYMQIIKHIVIINISCALKCQQNYSLNMCNFSALTNNGKVTMRLMAIGRTFHNNNEPVSRQ